MTPRPPMHKPKPRRDLPPGVESRMVAMQLLHRVLAKGRTVEQAWEHEQEALWELEPADAGFVRALVLGTLRHLGQIDTLLMQLIETPLPTKAAPVLDALRLGIAQLLWLNVPHHAAVHSTVELIRAARHPNYCALANAVLQRVLREQAQWVKVAEDAALMNLPMWLRARLEQAYGADGLRAILQAQMEYGSTRPAYTDLTLVEPENADALVAALPEGSVVLPNGSVRVAEAGRVERLAGYAEGLWWVQDAAATIPVQWLLSITGAERKRVLDVCAAPGGKTAQLIAAKHAVTALDLSDSRLKRLRENLVRLNMEADVVVADASDYVAAEKFDAVLLDAPCSATGTIRRHPELSWQRLAADVARLTDLQARMLDQAEHWVKPGGVMVYAVCSLLPEEGEVQIAELLERSNAWEAVALSDAELQAFGLTSAQRTKDGALRLLPSDWAELGGMDGFFAACLRRRL